MTLEGLSSHRLSGNKFLVLLSQRFDYTMSQWDSTRSRRHTPKSKQKNQDTHYIPPFFLGGTRYRSFQHLRIFFGDFFFWDGREAFRFSPPRMVTFTVFEMLMTTLSCLGLLYGAPTTIFVVFKSSKAVTWRMCDVVVEKVVVKRKLKKWRNLPKKLA